MVSVSASLTSLKVVEPQVATLPLPSFPERWKGVHSLHMLAEHEARTHLLPHPDLIAFILEKFTSRDHLVVDIFGGNAVVAAEVLLRGRRLVVNEPDPLQRVALDAVLQPIDIAQIALFLQQVRVGGVPFDIERYENYFLPFYCPQTFAELCSLKRVLLGSDDKTGRYLKALALALLHGRTAGYFSAYSPRRVALSPTEQLALNTSRGQHPDYRAVVPRLLRRASQIARDSFPSVLLRNGAGAVRCDRPFGERLPVSTASVGAFISSLPMPWHRGAVSHDWLKRWICGIPSSVEYDRFDGVEDWRLAVRSSLQEAARIAKKDAVFSLIIPPVPEEQEASKHQEALKVLLQMFESSEASSWRPSRWYLPSMKRLPEEDRGASAGGLSIPSLTEKGLRKKPSVLILTRR